MSPLWDSFLHQRFKRHYQKRLLILGVLFDAGIIFDFGAKRNYQEKYFAQNLFL